MSVRPSRLLAAALAVTALPGCAVTMYNRYSVFGFNHLETDSAVEARWWSLALLAAVAFLSTVAGSGLTLLVQRRQRRRSRVDAPAASPRESVERTAP